MSHRSPTNWADIAAAEKKVAQMSLSPRRGTFHANAVIDHPPAPRVDMRTLVARPQMRPAPSRSASRSAPRAGARRVRNKRSAGPKRGFNFGDLTLRDAADVTGAVLRGGVRLATAIFNVEEKLFDTQISAVAGAAVVNNLSNIAEGDNYNNRQGLSIKARNLVFNYTLYLAGTANNFARIIIFQDMENQGVDPAPADVLEDVSSNVKALNSPYLRFTGNRFRVLADEHHCLTSYGPTTYIMRRLVMPVDNHLLYQSTTGADASNWNGAIFVMYMSDVSTSGPALNVHARLTFVDN